MMDIALDTDTGIVRHCIDGFIPTSHASTIRAEALSYSDGWSRGTDKQGLSMPPNILHK
ncbi:MAG: hypothetical protein HZB37_00390 [Planctomycetes bacterium]|nr:hypothetical protein [Planctomycetota bacterium]